MARQGTSPWLYLGCGCCGCIGLCVLAVVAMAFFGATMFQGYVEELGDPETRAARVRTILGTETLPEGYHAQMFFSVPWIIDAVILGDGPGQEWHSEDLDDVEPLGSEHVGDHVFVYLSVRGDGDGSEIEDIFHGRNRGEVDIDLGSRFKPRDLLGEGALELDAYDFDYKAYLGELRTEDGERIDGIYSQMQIHCPQRNRDRVAIWFARGPEDLDADEAAELPGTPADRDALGRFMGHFDLCTN